MDILFIVKVILPLGNVIKKFIVERNCASILWNFLNAFRVVLAWHELNNSKPHYIGCKEKLEELLQQILDFTTATQEDPNPSE